MSFALMTQWYVLRAFPFVKLERKRYPVLMLPSSPPPGAPRGVQALQLRHRQDHSHSVEQHHVRYLPPIWKFLCCHGHLGPIRPARGQYHSI